MCHLQSYIEDELHSRVRPSGCFRPLDACFRSRCPSSSRRMPLARWVKVSNCVAFVFIGHLGLPDTNILSSDSHNRFLNKMRIEQMCTPLPRLDEWSGGSLILDQVVQKKDREIWVNSWG
ncbi:hypothetical protein TWF694_003572 [Orbilia ellipsospora]|uniref:Uncharacterized protein n=1 Tax=Orbilia ellipsospora TaxID=2528407 RepID=A0AAV9WYI4_9PEZI